MSNIERSQSEMRGKIMALEDEMKGMTEHWIEIKTTHYFAPGIYMREIFIPKGTTLTGKIHKTEHMNVLSQGELSVMTDEGVKRLKASTVVKSQPGIKRVGYAHEDSVWITIHKNENNETDLEKIEDFLLAKTFADVPKVFETVFQEPLITWQNKKPVIEEKKICQQ